MKKGIHMKSLFDLSKKVAVVVGGSRGLGKGMATGLAKCGATVVIASRGLEACQKTAEEIENTTKGHAVAKKLDITSVDAINEFVKEVVGELGHIDILINSAGINIRKPALEYQEEDWNKVTDTQQKYVFFMNQAVAKHMVEKGIKGRIINLGSISSQVGLKNIVAYVSSKGAIMQMTKALANEWAQYGITVNAIAPGYCLTEMTKPLLTPEVIAKYEEKIPESRLGTPEDMEGIAAFLASDSSAYVTGQTIFVDGGWIIN